MRHSLGCLFVYSNLLSLLVTVLAKDDPDYNSAENFRPGNVTGLNSMYAWVGSYYNATTEVTVTPQMGPEPGDALCPPLQNYTTTMKWTSILAITERGTYNTGPNPVNIWLTLIPPNYNWSTLPWDVSLVTLRGSNHISPLVRDFDLFRPTWIGQENITAPPDYFNITATKSQNTFSLGGILNDPSGHGSWSYDDHIWMPTCNSSYYYGNWSLTLLQIPGDEWWSTQGWRSFMLPKMIVTFDEQTANFTLDGDFQAYPFLRSNDTNYIGGLNGELGPGVQGTIRFTFKGVLDAYHSDVLNMNASSPTWLRTVGFGNNTLNIGNGAIGRLRPSLGAATIVITCIIFAVFY
ncbi:hypothetical protein N7474_010779 [Penicillium riverlandense]|uniref:uncharacterized protein n=1 Tax=Penicillium riverlandense TaxID=1903569 RepID=UPI002547949B|nr:uncharacterized protein N7474_010779 [Penicillium riverlandense]KAJ5804892.1 hypothetical protein N7474_010779 [Penicillium riverlandense]